MVDTIQMALNRFIHVRLILNRHCASDTQALLRPLDSQLRMIPCILASHSTGKGPIANVRSTWRLEFVLGNTQLPRPKRSRTRDRLNKKGRQRNSQRKSRRDRTGKPLIDQRAERPWYVVGRLGELLELAESNSYFDLSRRQRQEIENLTAAIGKPILAWSFIPHPTVIESLQYDRRDKRQRYIVIVDSMCAAAYFPIADLLKAFRLNVTSYVTGGWADFICDAFLTETEKHAFLSKVDAALEEYGRPHIGTTSVKKLVSVFRVERELIRHRQTVDEQRPTQTTVDRVCEDHVRFETALQNYRSPSALAFFGNDEKKLATYLRELVDERIILGFNPIFPHTSFFDTEVVPIIGFERASESLVQELSRTDTLRQSVIDVLEVQPLQCAHGTEKLVQHIALCEFTIPGQRNLWREQLYGAKRDQTNIYTYPIEGCLHEATVSLSDYPDHCRRAMAYSTPTSSLRIGALSHVLAPQDAPIVFLPAESLAAHGITLGWSGTGKTNTDLLLVDEALAQLSQVVVLDSTGGLRAKLPNRLSVRAKFSAIGVQEAMDPIFVRTSVFEATGFTVAEVAPKAWPQLLRNLVEVCDGLPDVGVGNTERHIHGLLMLEEAQSIWGESEVERAAVLQSFEGMLLKAFRKGWAVWVSTQLPNHLSRNNDHGAGVLSLLKNRIIHRLPDETAIQDIERVFVKELGHSNSAELEALGIMLRDTPAFVAVLRGATCSGGDVKLMPAVKVKVRKVEEDVT